MLQDDHKYNKKLWSWLQSLKNLAGAYVCLSLYTSTGKGISESIWMTPSHEKYFKAIKNLIDSKDEYFRKECVVNE